jgi:signal transduction histidine kinase
VLTFWLAVHQISGLWLDVALRPEVREMLERSMTDQKRLRNADPANSQTYRSRFESMGKLMHRLDVIRMNRAEMMKRFEMTLVAMFATIAAVGAVLLWTRYRRAQALERSEYLDRVAVLQETARRQAHEIKGPLTAARLELERLGDAIRHSAGSSEIAAAQASITEELDRLARFAREYSTFAGIGSPVLRPVMLAAFVDEFCATFSNAWPGIVLGRERSDEAEVCADRDMLRQVFVNLCTNSARAMESGGNVRFAISRRGGPVLDVCDTGSGIAESLRSRIFDPYVTTRRMGEGMGLGLSIARKIMLDHGGDLELLSTSSEGTTFRLTFGDDACS